MSVNLLDLAKGYLSDALVDKAASFLGESSESTKSGLNHVLPALMGGVMNKATSASGASDLLSMLNRPEMGSGLLDNLGDLFGGSNSGVMDTSGNLLSSIFGNKLGGITDLIGNAVGLKSGSSSGLLKMALPMLLSVVGKKVANGGVSSLTSLLSGQKEHLKNAAPAGFLDKVMGVMGVNSLDNLNIGNVASSFSSAAKDTVKETTQRVEQETNKSGGNKWLPLLVIAALAALTFYLLKNCKGDKVEDTPPPVVQEEVEKDVKVDEPVVDDTVIKDVNSLYNAGEDLVGKTIEGFDYLGEFIKLKLKDGTELIVPAKGFEAQLVEFLESGKEVDKKTWFDMRRVLFKTGSADLDDRSMKQVEYITSILKAYPNVHLKLGGYTDNTGPADVNKKLSADRANSVMKAIVAKGIDAKRLAAEGYGPEHPIASNDTEEGRQLNRRVSARVSKK